METRPSLLEKQYSIYSGDVGDQKPPHMKKQNICLEVCPISNEILGFTNRIKGLKMYSLLTNDVHCTGINLCRGGLQGILSILMRLS